jgi:hypothetical protein
MRNWVGPYVFDQYPLGLIRNLLALAVLFYLVSPLCAQASRPLPGGMPPEGDPIYSLRDPFRVPAIALEKAIPKQPLELISIEKIELVGITKGRDRVVAMIRERDSGKTWFVRESMKLGDRGGVIERITPRKITVREQTYNALGQEETKRVDIELNKDRENPLLQGSVGG